MFLNKIKALEKLRPNSKWIWSGEDYSNLEWIDTEQTKPTEEEINNKASTIETEEKQAKIDADNKKTSAKQKLQDLGLTVDEIKEAFGI